MYLFNCCYNDWNQNKHLCIIILLSYNLLLNEGYRAIICYAMGGSIPRPITSHMHHVVCTIIPHDHVIHFFNYMVCLFKHWYAYINTSIHPASVLVMHTVLVMSCFCLHYVCLYHNNTQM